MRIAESLLRGGQSVTADEDVMENRSAFINGPAWRFSFGVTKVTAKSDTTCHNKAFAEAQEVLVEAFMDGTRSIAVTNKDKSVLFPLRR